MHIVLFTSAILLCMVFFSPKHMCDWVCYQSPRLDNHFFELRSDQHYQGKGSLVKKYNPHDFVVNASQVHPTTLIWGF